MTVSELKAYREKKRLKLAAAAGQASRSTPSGPEDTSATVSGAPSRKRQHEEITHDDARSAGPDDDVEIIEPTPLNTIPADTTAPSAKSRSDKGKVPRPNLRVTSDPNEVGSLWHRDFPFADVINQHLIGLKDDEKINSLGLPGCLLALEAYGLRVAGVARSAERHYGDHERAGQDMARPYRKLKDRVTELEGEATKVSGLAHDVGVLREACEDWAKAKDKWEKQKVALEENVAALHAKLEAESCGRKSEAESLRRAEERIVGLENDKEELKEEIAEQHELGFDKALAQIRLLYLDLDLSGTGCFKEIKEGRLVEVADPDGQDEDADQVV